MEALFAQKASVQLSPEFKLPKRKIFKGHLYSDASSHYVYFNEYGSGKQATVILEKFDSKFGLVYSKEFKSSKENTTTLGIKYLKGGLAWLVSERSKKDDYLKYHLAPISFDGKMGKASQIANFPYEGRRDEPDAEWITSADTSKVLFTAVSDKNRDEDKLEIYLSVVDNNFQTLWDRKVKLDKTEEQVEVKEWVLTADGDVFMLAKIYDSDKAKESKKGKKGKAAGYHMEIYHFSKAKPEPAQYALKLGESFIKGSTIATNQVGELVAIGFFANTLKGSTSGIFYMRMSPTDGSVLAVKKHGFSSKEIEILGEDNTSKDNEGEDGIDASFKFKDILFRADGSTLVTAEENFVETRTYYNASSKTWDTRYVYYSKDIIAFNIGKTGEINNTTLIPKRQKFSTPTFEYFTTLVNKDDVYFFYNDDADNLKKPIGSKPKYISSFKDCTAVMTKLDSEGKLDRKKILDSSDAEALFVPSNSRQFSENQLFFVCMKFRLLAASDFRMGVVSLID